MDGPIASTSKLILIGRLLAVALIAQLIMGSAGAMAFRHTRPEQVQAWADDQTALAKVAIDEKQPIDARIGAVAKLKDQAVLAKLAEADIVIELRKAAIHKLTNNAILQRIAAQDKTEDIRIAATSRIVQQHVTLMDASQMSQGVVAVANVIVTVKTTEEAAMIGRTKNGAFFKATAKGWNQLSDSDMDGLPRACKDALNSKIVKELFRTIDHATILMLKTHFGDDVGDDQLCKNALLAMFGDGYRDTSLVTFSGDRPPESDGWKAARDPLSQHDLAEMASNNKMNREFQKSAVEQLTDQAMLAKVAEESGDYEVCEACVQNLTDQALLCRIAEKSRFANNPQSNWVNVQLAAVRGLSDHYFLAKIALEDVGGNISKAATLKLTDQDTLAIIAINAKDTDGSLTAVQKLTDQALLGRVLVESRDRNVLKTALDKLSDQVVLGSDLVRAALARIALRESQETLTDEKLENSAVGKITDQPTLLKIAMNEAASPSTRQLAVEELTDQGLLKQVALQENGRDSLQERAIARIADQAVITQVALEAEDEEVGYAAVDKLTDQALLSKIAQSHRFMWVRERAVASLTDRVYLAKFARSTYYHVAEIARLRLFLTDPVAQEQLGRTRVAFSAESHWEHYRNSRGETTEVQGETVTITISGGKLSAKLGASWTTGFPGSVGNIDPLFVPAHVKVNGLIGSLLKKCDQRALTQLAQRSSDSQVRVASKERLAKVRSGKSN